MTWERRNGNDTEMLMKAIGRMAEAMDRHDNSENDGDGGARWE